MTSVSVLVLNLYPFSSKLVFNNFAYSNVTSASVVPSFISPLSVPPCPASIKIIPLYVSFDDEIYKDGEEITSEKLYELVKEKKIEFSKSSLS